MELNDLTTRRAAGQLPLPCGKFKLHQYHVTTVEMEDGWRWINGDSYVIRGSDMRD